MNRVYLGGLSLLSMISTVACTSIPKSETPTSAFATMSCADLEAETAKSRETLRVATEARSDSWHVIFPVLVGARYANAQSSLTEAQERLAKLAAEQQGKGCVQAPAEAGGRSTAV